MKNFLSGSFLLVFCIMILLSACDTVYASNVIKPDSVVKVHDGDTFTVNISGCPDVFCKRLSVRISGIDTPEMKGKCPEEIAGAIAAKNYLTDKVMNANDIVLSNPTRDKYFRINAHVLVSGVDVGADMVSKGLARAYSGGKRARWCPENTV